MRAQQAGVSRSIPHSDGNSVERLCAYSIDYPDKTAVIGSPGCELKTGADSGYRLNRIEACRSEEPGSILEK